MTDLDYKAIFKKLNGLNIDYLVVGGLAVNFHGVPRMTYDIDLMISLEGENIRKLMSLLTTWGYRPKVPLNPEDLADEAVRTSWIRDKGMKALNLYSESLPVGEIDLVIDSPISYVELKKRAVKIELEGSDVPTVSIHDLIQLKKHAGRKQDLADIEHLRRVLEK
jgi:Holliday junction resolvase-like predicted endonuclease